MQNAFRLVHKSFHTTCPKITHGVLILALGGSSGHSKDWNVTLEDGPSPSALRGALATVGGGLASAYKPRLRLRQGPSSGMVLLMIANVVRLSQVTHAGLAARDSTCHPPLHGLVSPQNPALSACTKGSIQQRMVQSAFGPLHKSLHTTCPKITHGVLMLALGGSRGHSKDWNVTLENGPSPSALRGGLASAFRPRLRLRQGPSSGMVLLMVANVVRLSQVTHAGLAARDSTCHPPLQGLVSPQNPALSACTKGSIQQRMVQTAFGPLHKSLHTTCPKITHGVLILALGGSSGHSKDWNVTLENGPSPSALRGALATVGGGLASAYKPRLRLRQGPSSGMVLLMVANVVRLSQVTHAGLAARDSTCHPPLQGLVSPQNPALSACTEGSIQQRMVQNAFGPLHKSLHTTCPKITHGVLILALGGSRGHSKDWNVTLENGPSPSALRGALATVGGGLASA